MRASRIAAAAGLLALIAGAGAAGAQGLTPQRGRIIEVAPGAVVLVLPPGSMPVMTSPGPMMDTAFPFPAIPSAGAIVRQMHQMMLDAERAFQAPAWTSDDRTIEVAMRQMQQSGPVSGVIVTSISDASGTCTRQVTYSGNSAAPKVEVRSTGNACASLGVPAAQPEIRSPEIRSPEIRVPGRAMPRTIEVRNRVPTTRLAPIEVAQAR